MADRMFEQDKRGRSLANEIPNTVTRAQMHLRPPLCAFYHYDMMRGSKDAETPFRYDLYYRHFLYVAEGSVKVRITTPNTSDTINVIKDATIFEFRSAVNPWCVNTTFRTKEIILEGRSIIHIPAYWWYSVKYTTVKDRLYSFKYHTYASACTVIPNLL